MDINSNIKKRREERIKQLLTEPQNQGNLSLPLWNNEIDLAEYRIQNVYTPYPEQIETVFPEPDPELVWKQNGSRWRESPSTFYPGDSISPEPGKSSSFWRMMRIRILLSAAIFGALWGIQRYQPPWSLPITLFVKENLTHEMDFTAAEVWYENHFGGAPSFIPIFGQQAVQGEKVQGSRIFSSPLTGTIAQPFALNLKGIEIIPASKSISGLQIRTVETGRISDISQDAVQGLTVQIQHAGGYMSVYAHLGSITVEKGDWVEGGTEIGTLKTASAKQKVSPLYFALKKDGRYIDPADVIPFD
ncbi:stage IV sporulation protein FA [Paenibacillus shirakamiensis]|uniref:Stage IV sporulation protein FA n=1 Tax=Paenibacillus shirakamiensis TaxID=1265935 RepID=A0ABS4JFA5_9BACL|nr:M23 family metallopeptidase [Paenibacillus shirakamiensis]MBP2000397.1 stage IV sporulation protein FA [Paenibacillus shirakamiensis]